MLTPTLEQAYATCEGITRDQARNFYYGIRLLPPAKRSVLCAVYALARRIDDIGDGDLPAAEKRARLAGVRASVAALTAGEDGGDPVLAALADAARHHPIPFDAFDELVDGVAMDVEMDTTGARYATFADLVGYCRCVAGSVGRLCLGVFGSRPDPRAPAYADALGVALQQTNVLRDIREDLANGRVYLPQEDLDRFGVDLRLDAGGALADDGGALSALVRHGCARAQTWYDDGLRLVPLLDRRSAACCLAMSGIYRRLTERFAAEPSLVRDRRVSLSGREKAVVAARSLAGRR
ncbi:presqualene diphosphate synthase HpnD [Geodermatophilus sp. SYSU D00758]